MTVKKNILIVGDILSLAVMTVIGFATHGEVGTSFIVRMGASFFPLLIGWWLSAPRFGLFHEQAASNPKLLWQVFAAMLLAAPFAVIVRAALLHSAGQPLFALVLGGMNGLGILVWRGVYIFYARKFGRLAG